MPSVFGLNLLFCFVGGSVLGGAYFGGLWWSVNRVTKVEKKKSFLFFSWVVRSVVLFGGLYLAARYDWRYLLAAFAGVIVVRSVMVRWMKKQMGKIMNTNKLKEVSEC